MDGNWFWKGGLDVIGRKDENVIVLCCFFFVLGVCDFGKYVCVDGFGKICVFFDLYMILADKWKYG